MKQPRILFVKRGRTRFEDQDLKLLSQTFEVTEFQPEARNIGRVFSLVRNHDILFYWFPNDYKFFISLIAKVLGKKVVVVGGGQMSTADTRKGRKRAGVVYRPLFIWLGILAVKLSDLLIAVSRYEQKGLSRYRKESEIALVYNNYSTELFHQYPEEKQPNLVITVSAIDEVYYVRKGLDIFIELAERNPDYEFVLIGKFADQATVGRINARQIPNLKLTGFVSDDELVDWLKKANVYCQFSRQEGFGVALAEAQACGCVPFVSGFGAIPEVAGPDAFYIDENPDWNQMKLILEKCRGISGQERSKFAERVKNEFGSGNRGNRLAEIIRSAYKDSPQIEN